MISQQVLDAFCYLYHPVSLLEKSDIIARFRQVPEGRQLELATGFDDTLGWVASNYFTDRLISRYQLRYLFEKHTRRADASST